MKTEEEKCIQCPACKHLATFEELEGKQAGELQCPNCNFIAHVSKPFWLGVYKKHQPELELVYE